MGKYQDIDDVVDGAIKKLYTLAERTLELMNEEVDRAMDEANHEFGMYQQAKITGIFRGAVGTFYDAYTPKYYKDRKFGLYEILDLKTDDAGMVISNDPGYLDMFDPAKMHPDRSGGDSLFQTVFMEGYHGGAKNISGSKLDVWGSHPNPGTPYYRRPGKVTYSNGIKKWHRYGRWGPAAIRTTAPYTMFAENLKVAEAGEIYDKFKEISDNHNSAAMEKVYQSIPKLQQEIYG